MAGVSAVITIIGPNKIGDITNLIKDGLFTSIDISAILQITIFLAVMYVIGALCGFLQNYIIDSVTLYMSKRLRTAIDKKISALPLNYFTDNS